MVSRNTNKTGLHTAKDVSQYFIQSPSHQKPDTAAAVSSLSCNTENEPITDDMSSISQINEEHIKNMINNALDEKFKELSIMIECMINDKLQEYASGRFHRHISRSHATQNTGVRHAEFCKENYTYLLMPFLTNLIKSSNDYHAILQKVICNLYFNQDYKINHIVHIPPTSYRCVAIMRDGEWKNHEFEPTLEKIICRANDILQHYVIGTDEHEESEFRTGIGKKKYDALIEFTNKIDNMETFIDFRERLLNETEHSIITNQHLVHKSIFDAPRDVQV